MNQDSARWALIAALLLGGALLPAGAEAYTVKHTANGATVRWTVDRLTVSIDRSLHGHGERPRRAMALAASAWSGLGGPEIQVERGFYREDYRPLAPGVQVVLADDWAYAPGLLAVTATSYEEHSGRIVDADILVNPEPPLDLLEDEGDASRYDLGALLTHETGHVLGLGETETDPLATMWPRIARGDTHQRTVETDDADGITEAYAAATLTPRTGCSGNHVATRHVDRVAPLAIVGLVVGLLLWLTWRRQNERGKDSRGTDHRRATAPAAGIVFAAAVGVLVLPTADDDRPDEPVAVRAARALTAVGRPSVERRAILNAAARDQSPAVRRAALRAALGAPVREDLELVDHLLEDTDEATRAHAIAAWETVRRAPPARRITLADAHAPTAALLAERPERRVRAVAAEMGEDGWIRTRVQLDGGTLELRGGCADGLCQRIGEQPLPLEGEALRVDLESGAWARSRDALMWGGWLGHGPAVALSVH